MRDKLNPVNYICRLNRAVVILSRNLKHSGKQSYICQLSRNRLLRHDANVVIRNHDIFRRPGIYRYFYSCWNDLNQLIKVSDFKSRISLKF